MKNHNNTNSYQKKAQSRFKCDDSVFSNDFNSNINSISDNRKKSITVCKNLDKCPLECLQTERLNFTI